MDKPELNLADRPTLGLLRKRIADTLKPLGEELGLEFIGGGISYTGDGSKATMKLEMNRGSAEAASHVEFARLSLLFGLKPEHFGATITTPTGQYSLCGINPKSHKYPFLAKRPDGKVYKFSRDQVVRQLLPEQKAA